MSERQPHFFDERFETLRFVQGEFERRGYLFQPVPKEHIEAGITDPLVTRITAQIKKRGFEKLAGKVAITFSGYATDPREVFAIPEIRAYWQHLDGRLPELPALLAYLPHLGFNGPSFHLMLLGTIDEAIARPEVGGYDVLVAGAEPILADSVARIHQAAHAHRLRPITTKRLIDNFIAGATFRFHRP